MADFDIGKFADKFASDLPNIINFAADIIVLDIPLGIKNRTDINNRAFKQLKIETIRQKAKQGAVNPGLPLVRFDTMRNVYVKDRATRFTPIAIVIMPKTAEYGTYHNKGGNKGNNPPQREWFGVSIRADKKIDKMIAERLKVL